MKLKNKISGEIKEFALFDGNELQGGATLESLTKEWEDVPEEPKDNNYWYIDDFGRIQFSSEILDESEGHPNNWMIRKLFGNYFETKEGAEKAVERLRAWKRLKDKGFRFTGCYMPKNVENLEISASCEGAYLDIMDDLDLLFSGGGE